MHGRHGYLVLVLAVLLSGVDILAAIRRFILFIRSDEPRTFKLFWNRVILNKDVNHMGTGSEYTGLIMKEPEDLELPQISRQSSDDGVFHKTAQWANDVRNHHRSFSLASDGTVFGPRSPTHSDTTLAAQQKQHSQPKNLVHRVGNAVFATLERFLVFAGFAQLLTGIVIYTGS